MKTQQYTCPMHPDIIQDQPGSCPICGMALEPMTVSKREVNTELVDMTRRFWISVSFTVPILLLTMGMYLPGLSHFIHLIPVDVSNWMQFILATPVTLWAGWIFLKKGYVSLIKRQLNMFTLIALGISVAYFYSFFVLLIPQSLFGEIHLYFEAAAVITTLVLLGQVLELRGRDATSGALRALLDLSPQTANRINNGSEEKITLDEVRVGDLLKIRPGEKVPVDGTIIEGHSTIDESMMTGESIPVEKENGATVIGATINLSGSFVMHAEKVGHDTMLSQIVSQVSEAQRSRAPIQRMADYIASLFVPIVLLVAIITFFAWFMLDSQHGFSAGLISAISVLIIACPCALGLATPMSIMVGMGRGAQMGVLIRNAESLERFEKINTLVLDKTGTLTQGKPVLKKIIPLSTMDENQILLLAASLENNSEHPLAHAIVSDAREKKLNLITPTQFSAEIGQGVMGKIGDQSVALGNAKLLDTLSIQNTARDKVEELQKAGATVMYLVVDQTIAGLISVADTIKPTTVNAIAQLKQAGIHLVMVTGDHQATARAVATQVDIQDVQADVLPQEKNNIIKKLKESGKKVAMAGDGINDAAALAEADIGIAMGTGTDIAIKSADITLVKGDLLGIVRAYYLSKNVMRNIRQNLFLAFAYNTLCIPIAAGVLYPWTGLLLNPMIGALAMSLSSVSVIWNALRLRV